MEMLFTGSPISAHEALLHGLISKVVPEGGLEENTLAIARRVCQSSRPVVALGKATFYRYKFLFVDMTDISGSNETQMVFFMFSTPKTNGSGSRCSLCHCLQGDGG